MLIVCIDDRKSKFLKLNEIYTATESDTCYIINLDENNIKRPAGYRRSYLKADKKRFVKIGKRSNINVRN